MERSRENSLRAILKVKDWNSEQQKHEALVDHLQVGLYRGHASSILKFTVVSLDIFLK